jgi:CheY-like chemotaxis protein
MKIRALIFDDDALILALLKEVLERRGYEVFTFSEPGVCPLYKNAEGICTGDHQCADIILSDIRMPNVSGIDLIEKLDKSGCKVKHRALISGSWTPSELAQAKELNCKMFDKPFKIEQLENWLDECEKSIDPNRILSNWVLH